MRTVPTLAAGALLLAACGSDDVLQPPTETIAPETTVTDPPTTPDASTTSAPATSSDASASSSSDVERSTTTEPGSVNPAATSRPTTSGRSTPDQLADVAIDDLMTRIGAERSEIGVRSVDEVTWRDGSIGCPDPDFAYTQALVPGIRVVLDHDGFAYHYHQGGGRDLFYCPTPAAPLETSTLE